MVYYNEIDPFCCQWLRNLIDSGHLPDGYVHEADIRYVDPECLKKYDQCHFFAGIGGWPLALSMAGWGKTPVWTGSCPCQPFSSASRGRGKGTNDERHLWPFWKEIIKDCRPNTIFGEQVAQSGNWFDEVCDDLENLDYSIGAAILPATAVGKDHARARIYFAGHSNRNSESGRPLNEEMEGMPGYRNKPRHIQTTNGLSSRMGRLGAYGNAVVPQVAAEFIKAVMECIP